VQLDQPRERIRPLLMNDTLQVRFYGYPAISQEINDMVKRDLSQRRWLITSSLAVLAPLGDYFRQLVGRGSTSLFIGGFGGFWRIPHLVGDDAVLLMYRCMLIT